MCIINCYDNYKIRGRCFRITQTNYNDDISSLSSGLSYPTFIVKPKPKIFFIKDMKQYNVQNAIEMKDICSVCIEAYEEGDKVVTLPCGHEFHKICIHPWLRNKIYNDIVPSCPMCKEELIVEYKEEIQETDKGLIIEQI